MKAVVGSIDEVNEEVVSNAIGVYRRWLISPRCGSLNFAIRLFRIEKGGLSPPDSHDWEHGVVILSGRGIVTLDEEKYEVRPGMFLFIPPKTKHSFKQTGDDDLIFICVIPGNAVPPGK